MRTNRPPSSVRVLVRIPVFRRLWGAITVSSFGDWLGLLATTALAAYLTKDASNLQQGAAVSGVLLTRLAPDLILGPVAGALVDRFDRRVVAVIGDTLAGIGYLSIAFVGTLPWLLVAQFLVEAVGLFSTPAKQAMWVNIVPRERLAVANQLNYVSMYGMVPVAALSFALLSTVAQFFGAPVVPGSDTSGALISGSTSSTAIVIALVVDAATYFVAAGTVFASRRLIPSFTGDRSTGRNIFSLIAEGIRFVSQSRIIRAIYIGILGAFGAGGLVAGVAQAYVATLGAGNAGYGILFGGVFTGLALGMLLGPKVLPTVPRRIIFTSSIGAAGVMLVVMSLMGDFVGALLTSAVMGLFSGIAWITGFTMIGHEVTDQLRGRVFAFVMSSVRLTLLGTIAAGPILAGAIGGHSVTLGTFHWRFTGPALVLAVGGVIAVVVSMFASRQVGGGLARDALQRALRRRRPDLLRNPSDHPGALITVEGPDPELVDGYQASIVEYVRTAGHLVIAESIGTAGPAVAAGSEHGGPAGHDGVGRDADDSDPAVALRAVAHLADVVGATVRPALEDGAVAICSGYVDAAVVRFGACGGQDDEQILQMALWAADRLYPDLTVLIDGGTPGPSAGSPGSSDGEAVQAPAVGAPAVGASAVGASAQPRLDNGPTGEPDEAVDQSPDVWAAYRDRAGAAPERYLTVHGSAELLRGGLTLELTARIDSVLREKSLTLAEPAPVPGR